MSKCDFYLSTRNSFSNHGHQKIFYYFIPLLPGYIHAKLKKNRCWSTQSSNGLNVLNLTVFQENQRKRELSTHNLCSNCGTKKIFHYYIPLLPNYIHAKFKKNRLWSTYDPVQKTVKTPIFVKNLQLGARFLD